MHEIGVSTGHTSPEGAAFYHRATGTATVIFQTSLLSNVTTMLRLWQSQSVDAGLTWSEPAPMRIPGLMPQNVSSNTHISPNNGIELREGMRIPQTAARAAVMKVYYVQI